MFYVSKGHLLRKSIFPSAQHIACYPAGWWINKDSFCLVTGRSFTIDLIIIILTVKFNMHHFSKYLFVLLMLPLGLLGGERSTVIIHKQGEVNCHTFRIPGITRTLNGTLLAVYDMRYNSRRDLQGHMDIGLSRSTDGGKTWEAPRPIMDMGSFGGLGEDQNGCSDPNILVDRQTGEIFVAALWTHGKPGTHQWRAKGSEPGHDITQSTQFIMVRSTDD